MYYWRIVFPILCQYINIRGRNLIIVNRFTIKIDCNFLFLFIFQQGCDKKKKICYHIYKSNSFRREIHIYFPILQIFAFYKVKEAERKIKKIERTSCYNVMLHDV